MQQTRQAFDRLAKVQDLMPVSVIDQNIDVSKLKYDPDEKWSNLYRDKEKNQLYKWVGDRAGGTLVEAFERDGDLGVIRFALEFIQPNLYHDGQKPQVIDRNEYTKWLSQRSSDNNINQKKASKRAGFGADGKDARDLSFFFNHNAATRLNRRGIEGESIIHLLLKRQDDRLRQIALCLLNQCPTLAHDVYESETMFGQSALHMAIMLNASDMAALLIKLGSRVGMRATGSFFRPEDQKNYWGYNYFGEYPLSLAACMGNKDIYDQLVAAGADPNWKDSCGNTVLHICVIRNSIDMYRYAVRHYQKPANYTIRNDNGYTPLSLASMLGRSEIFAEMLELSKVEFWRYGDMTCSAYPLNVLDTLSQDGSTNWDSVLMTVINGTTNAHLDIVGMEVIQRLLMDKWNGFAKRKLFERLALLIVHLLLISIVTFTRTESHTWSGKAEFSISALMDRSIVIFMLRVAAELGLTMSLLWFIIQQLIEVKSEGLRALINNLTSAPSRFVFLMSNIFILCAIVARIAGQPTIEDAFLAMAVPSSWAFLLFFARSIILTGPFVQMIYEMVSGDIVRFVLMSSIFLAIFSQPFYFSAKGVPEVQRHQPEYCGLKQNIEHKISSYQNITETVMTLIRAAMGAYDYEEFYCMRYEILVKVLFFLYMVLMPIMLINMLIAMMGTTYNTVIMQAEKAWRKQVAQIIIVLERAMKKDKLTAVRLEYSIPLDDDRGLVVVKQTNKSNARRRNDSVGCWQRNVRKVVELIRAQGVSNAKDNLHFTNRRASHFPGVLTGDKLFDNLLGRLPPPALVHVGETRVSRPQSTKVTTTASSPTQSVTDEPAVETHPTVYYKPKRRATVTDNRVAPAGSTAGVYIGPNPLALQQSAWTEQDEIGLVSGPEETPKANQRKY